MTIERRYRISKLRLRELSFVDEGDNPGAEVLITKRRADGETDVAKAIAEVRDGANELLELAAGEGGTEGIEKAARILGGMDMDIEQLQTRLEEIEGNIEALEKAKGEAEERATKAEADLATANAEIEKLRAADKGKGDDDGNDEDVLKALPQPIRERLEKAEKTAADAMAEVEKARDKGELDADIEKAKALGLKDADGIGGLLHRIRKGKSTAEDADKVVEVLTIAKAVGDEGKSLFEAIGKAKGKDAAATDAEDAQGKLDEAVEAIRKAKPSLTKEQAYSEALDANPELYDAINKRHPEAVSAE